MEDYCTCEIPAWDDAVAIATGRATLTGRKHRVWQGVQTGLWHVTRTAEPAMVAEPCS